MKSNTATRHRTISLTPVVDKIAAEMMAKKGYDNFSAYVADLIRRDEEREGERKPQKAGEMKKAG